MLIIDYKKSKALDITRLDWNPDNIKNLSEDMFAIPLYDPALKETAEDFSYEVAAQQPWAYPDTRKTTVLLQVDMSRSYYRFALLIGVKPDENFDDDCEDESTEFEEQRRKAVIENGGRAAYDTLPVMLNAKEEDILRTALFDKLNIY